MPSKGVLTLEYVSTTVLPNLRERLRRLTLGGSQVDLGRAEVGPAEEGGVGGVRGGGLAGIGGMTRPSRPTGFAKVVGEAAAQKESEVGDSIEEADDGVADGEAPSSPTTSPGEADGTPPAVLGDGSPPDVLVLDGDKLDSP